jgi:CheY-like chemotaxis protein
MAGSEEEAAERLGGRDFQVVLIDMKLPGADGRSVLKRVQGLCPDARTLLITGYRDEMAQMVDKALHEGADGVCYKPFDVPQLLVTLQSLTRRNE